ncbi:4-hydroxybenzoyl-CoA thioesterase [gamma proteobacterium BDW918]|uniref:4-hydroxybenzoyl-CoA thioesterase n=1 Tax=Zhongshania aliphaticivorans TaxID=1470434 RepID=A0A127M8P8_9GAMM|nr:4-hydroxybenzoyl-CoA thioesterase [Zhongshania aliphaticivorans]EIF42286.1 4-hydroxybenzoyl-CoA thioesterase [gamma proteobacterium BDW918]
MPGDSPLQDPFKVLVRIRYSDCDAQGVMFNARYGEYVDVAVTEFYRQVFGGYQAILDMGIDSQVVSLLIEWKSPCTFDDVVAISIEDITLGKTSYTIQLRFSDVETQREIASAKIVYVMVTANEHQKIDMPDDFRAALTQSQPCTVNLAGV